MREAVCEEVNCPGFGLSASQLGKPNWTTLLQHRNKGILFHGEFSDLIEYEDQQIFTPSSQS